MSVSWEPIGWWVLGEKDGRWEINHGVGGGYCTVVLSSEQVGRLHALVFEAVLGEEPAAMSEARLRRDEGIAAVREMFVSARSMLQDGTQLEEGAADADV